MKDFYLKNKFSKIKKKQVKIITLFCQGKFTKQTNFRKKHFQTGLVFSTLTVK